METASRYRDESVWETRLEALDDPRLCIPPGDYLVAVVGARKAYYSFYKRSGVVLECKIQDGDFTGAILERYFTVPEGGKIGRGSDYYAEWCLANGGELPRRRERLPPKKFRGKLFRAAVVTVATDRNGQSRPRYSKIARFLELVVSNESLKTGNEHQ